MQNTFFFHRPRVRVALGFGLVLVLALSAVVLGGYLRQEAVDPRARELVIAAPAELDGTDIQQVWGANIVQELISAAPVVFDLENESLVPQVAQSIAFSEDGKSITLVFPGDLKFANGRPATGKDIEASIRRFIEISPYKEDWAWLTDIAVNGQEVTLTFAEPPAYLLAVIASVFTGMVDVEEANRVGKEAFNRRAIGIGPYLLQEWVAGSHATFTRNEHYRDFKPFVQNRGPWHFDTVTVRIIPDAFTRLSELEAGNVDFAAISLEHRARVAANPDLTLLTAPGAGQTYLRFNLHRAPFNNLKFRQTINFAINKAEIQAALDNAVVPVYGLLSPAQLAFNRTVEDALKRQNAHNWRLARAFLTEMGYIPGPDGILQKDGKPLTFTILSTVGVTVQELAAPVIQSQLRALGIDARLEKQGRPYVRELIRTNNFDMAFAAWSWPDPDIWFFSFHSSNPNPIWTTPELDAILENGRSIMDMTQRAAKYGELSMLVGEYLPIIPLFYTYSFSAHRTSLEGLHVGVDGTLHWNDARKR